MKKALFAMALVGLITASASATALSSVSTHGSTLFDPLDTNGSSPQNISLNYFNASLGTLVSVDVMLKQTVNGFVTNDDANGDADATLNSTVSFASTGRISGSTALAPPPSFTNIVTNETKNVVNEMSTSNPFAGPNANFIGVGTYSVTATNTGGWTVSAAGSGGSGTVQATFDSDVLAEVWVTYNYEPIPEPASMALLGLGGLALIRRRK